MFQKHLKTSPKGPIFYTRGFSVMANTNAKEFFDFDLRFLYTVLTLIQDNFQKYPKTSPKGPIFYTRGFSVMANTILKELFDFDFRIPIYCIDPDSG